MTRDTDLSTGPALIVQFRCRTSRREHSDRRNDQPSAREQQLALIAEARAARRLAYVQGALPHGSAPVRSGKSDAEQFG